MKILVTGSSGLVGTALGSALARAGHTVCRLVRPQSAAGEGATEGFAVAWAEGRAMPLEAAMEYALEESQALPHGREHPGAMRNA